MRLYELIVALKSPTIIASRVSSKGYSKPMQYIPFSTLRGAIVTALYNNGLVNRDFLDREVERPSIITSPAYLYSNERGKSLPATPLHARCKTCNESTKLDEIIRAVKHASSSGDISSDSFRVSCENGHYANEILHPSPIFFRECSKTEISIFFSVSVGISRHRAASAVGMLFNYEAIKPGTMFWATLAVTEDRLDVSKGLELLIGRGVTRGFGHAEVKQVNEIDQREMNNMFSNILRESEYLVMYARSPVVSLDGYSYSTFPDKIKLDGGGLVEVRRIYGRTMNLHLGWDMRNDMERPEVEAVSQGAIIVTKVVGVKPEDLTRLAFTGSIENLWGRQYPCLNMLIPLNVIVEKGVF